MNKDILIILARNDFYPSYERWDEPLAENYDYRGGRQFELPECPFPYNRAEQARDVNEALQLLKQQCFKILVVRYSRRYMPVIQEALTQGVQVVVVGDEEDRAPIAHLKGVQFVTYKQAPLYTRIIDEPIGRNSISTTLVGWMDWCKLLEVTGLTDV